MPNIDFNKVNETKDKIIESSRKGFGYFFKNALLILSVIIIFFIIGNPDIIRNPEDFFDNFSVYSLVGVGIILFLICLVYQLSKGLIRTSDKEQADEIVKRYSEEQDRKEKDKMKKHAEYAMKRINNNPFIGNVLKDLLINTGADRASLCEMHNGTNSLAGMPFIYFSVTTEECTPDTISVRDYFNELNICKYPFISNHFKDGFWIGDMEQIEKEDKSLYAILKMINADYFTACVINGIETPIGFITLVWNSKDDVCVKNKLITELSIAAQKISTLLSIN